MNTPVTPVTPAHLRTLIEQSRLTCCGESTERMQERLAARRVLDAWETWLPGLLDLVEGGVSEYAQYLLAKAINDPSTGIAEPREVAAPLFPFQRDIVRWALRRGRAAVFAGIGTEVYVAAELGRLGLGIELKPSYFGQAVKNLQSVVGEHEGQLFGAAA